MSALFTVVVPVYNGQEYIQETLDSIFNQTYKNYELIVVDGASTDNTMKILEANKSRINLIISEKDQGMYDALRKGFDKSTGEYMCYINADDKLLPYTLEKVVQKFSEKQYDLVFGDVNYISETGKHLWMYKSVNFGPSAIRSLCRLPFAQQSSFWTRKIYFEKGGFDKSLRFVADSKFLFSICLDPAVKKAYIPLPLGEFRLHSTSLSIGSKTIMQQERSKLNEEMQLNKKTLSRMLYEFVTKIVNMKGIYQKYTYKGAKL